MSHAVYLDDIFSPNEFNKAVESIVEIINNRFSDVDYIVGSGISGAIIIGAISNITGKRIFIVRKENDDSHSSKTWGVVEEKEKLCEFEDFDKKVKTAIVIDDLIASGSTIRRILNKLWLNEILPVGIILYHEMGKEYNFDDSDHDILIPTISTKAWDD